MRNLNRLDLKHYTNNDPETIRKRAIRRAQERKYDRLADERLKNWKSSVKLNESHT